MGESGSEEDWLAPAAPRLLRAPDGPGDLVAAAEGDESEEDWSGMIGSGDLAGSTAIVPVQVSSVEPAGSSGGDPGLPSAPETPGAKRQRTESENMAGDGQLVAFEGGGQEQLAMHEARQESIPVGSPFAQYLTQAIAPSSKSFLKPAMALSEETGIAPSKFQQQLWAY